MTDETNSEPSFWLDGRPVYGSLGVLAYDAESGLVQCHVCGARMRRLQTHIRVHGLTSDGYRSRYRLGSQPLQAPDLQKPRMRWDSSAGRLHGEIGVLAYDELENRVQCHVCGGWRKAINNSHLAFHGLTAREYKEEFGLNLTTPLQVPDVSEAKRCLNLVQNTGRRLKKSIKGEKTGRKNVLQRRTPQYFKTHWDQEGRARSTERHRRFSDQQLLDAVSGLRSELGGIVTKKDVDARSRVDPDFPNSTTVINRLGPWADICGKIGQSPRAAIERRSQQQRLTATREDVLDALRELQDRLGTLLTRDLLLRCRRAAPPGMSQAVPTASAINILFGSWQGVLDALEQPPAPHREWSDDEILDALRRLERQIGRPFTKSMLAGPGARSGPPGHRSGLPSANTLRRRFGSVEAARAAMHRR
jgi:predicted transcriptional regulator